MDGIDMYVTTSPDEVSDLEAVCCDTMMVNRAYLAGNGQKAAYLIGVSKSPTGTPNPFASFSMLSREALRICRSTCATNVR